MYCANCKLDFPDGASRCTGCMGWLRAKRKSGEEPQLPAWAMGLETVPPEPVGPSHQEKLEAVLAQPKRRKAAGSSVRAGLLYGLAVALLGLAAVGGYVAWENAQLRIQARAVGGGLDSAALGQENLRQARAAISRKDWPRALQHGEAAAELLKGQAQAEARRLVRQATLGYADSLGSTAGQALKADRWEKARALSRQALALYQRFPETVRQQAEMIALEGRVWLREGQREAALSAFRRAHQLDPRPSYQALSREAKRMPVRSAVKTAEPAPDGPEQTLSLGDAPAYPTGTRASHRPPGASVAPLGPAPAAAPVRPRVNTYVPKKKADQKSKLNADVLPSYNDGK